MFGRSQRGRGEPELERYAALLRALGPADVADLEVLVCTYLAATIARPDFARCDERTQVELLAGAAQWALEEVAARRQARPSGLPVVPLRDHQPALLNGAHALARPAGVRELMVRLAATAQGERARHGPTPALAFWMSVYTLAAIATPPGAAPDARVLAAVSDTVRRRLAFGTFSAELPDDLFDVGPAVLTYLFHLVRIDDEWSVRDKRSFRWWGHRLAQTVTAEPPRSSRGMRVVLLRSECDVLRGVRDTPETYALLNELNQGASLDALVFDPALGTVRSLATAYFHVETFWLARVFGIAVPHQVAVSEGRADLLAAALDAEIAASAHPEHGPRSEPDEMLTVAEALRQEGRCTQPDDFRRLSMLPLPWRVRECSGDSVAFEVPLGPDGPLAAGDAMVATVAASDRPVEAREALTPRGRVGAGVQLRLRLPRVPLAGEPARMANALNLVEWGAGSAAHLLGAWCSEDGVLCFNSFLPALDLVALGDEDRSTVLLNLMLSLVGRAGWAFEQLRDGGAHLA